jgi:glyoxylase-like metal-dependent hydrolase (beta-lactamase superfamily II)
MFETTFLGHQGWRVRTATTCVLIDPLLTEGFGHGGRLGRMYPPRDLDPAALSPVDAVIVTHEHDDHFDVPSLSRIDRAIPVFVSSRSSVAAHEVVARMGFAVRPLRPDVEHAIGDLQYRTFSADHRDGRQGDEWDVCPFVLRDRAGHGSLVSSVDVRPTPQMLAALRDVAPRPGLWTYANNFTDVSFQRADGPVAPTAAESAALVRAVATRRAEIEAHWGMPLATLVVGAGWSFPGRRQWIDAVAFPLDNDDLAAALRHEAPAARVDAAVPGQTWVQIDGRLAQVRPRSPGITAWPRPRWPDRTPRARIGPPPDLEPACGRTDLPPAHWPALREGADDLARHLFDGPVFRGLHSYSAAGGHGRAPAVGLVLRTDAHGGHRTLRYEPRACTFAEEDHPDPRASLTGGLELWASDLHALCTGEIGPTALCYAGRLRVWNDRPDVVRLGPDALWTFAHPLRRPQAAARLYETLRTAASDVTVQVRGR